MKRIVLSIIVAICTLLAIGLVSLRPLPLPSYDTVKKSYQDGERIYLDRKGALLQRTKLDTNSRRREWVEGEEVPQNMREALIRVEDKRFLQHGGFDVRALLALPRDALRQGKLRGASTISMQLYGMLTRDGQRRSRTISGKIAQILGAIQLESSWSKEDILIAYLNLVPFRGNVEGLRAASQGLLQKEPRGLTREESFLLASLLASPNAKPARVAKRSCIVQELTDCKSLEELAKKALSKRAELPRTKETAAHFIRNISTERLIVNTTLDKDLQSLALEAVADQLSQLSKQNVQDAAVLVGDYRTGEILAYVGSSGKYSKAAEVDGVLAPRQAGSTLKPFLYAEAFASRLLTPQSLLLDSPMRIQTSSGVYAPQNYDESYRGIVTVRESLAASLNIPAVRTIDLLGVDRFYTLLNRLGFRLGPRQTYGHSLALGSLDVTLMQLVKAYGVLARGGSDWAMTLDRDSLPYVMPSNIFSSESTRAIRSILSDKVARASTFGLDNTLATPYFTAVKTGTSKDMRDNWCIGYSDRYVVGAWVGNFDGSPMWSVSGVTGAAPIWRTLMDRLHIDGEMVQVENEGEAITEEEPLKPLENRSAKTIVYPLEQTVIAFDPDIPERQQILLFESEEKLPSDHLWQLDGKAIKEGYVKLSTLKAGQHILQIADSKNQILDSVRFEKR